MNISNYIIFEWRRGAKRHKKGILKNVGNYITFGCKRWTKRAKRGFR